MIKEQKKLIDSDDIIERNQNKIISELVELQIILKEVRENIEADIREEPNSFLIVMIDNVFCMIDNIKNKNVIINKADFSLVIKSLELIKPILNHNYYKECDLRIIDRLSALYKMYEITEDFYWHNIRKKK